MTAKEALATASSVIAFDDPLPGGTDAGALLGGKAAGLAVMARDLGLPVPPGFVITTAVCRQYMLGGGLGHDVREAIAAHLGRLGQRTGRRFGDPSAPLLVSVRSGAPVSMPGMMDTILNAGITPEVRERLAIESGSPEFAADTWLRFCRMFAEIVLGVPREEAAAAALHAGDAESILSAAERVRMLAERFGGIPLDPLEQVTRSVEAVFRSWHSPRANVFREREGIPADLGTAATIQAMVFGNLDERSGTGVVFTRDPATGAPEPFGDYLVRAQGEDVVAGSHAVNGLAALREEMPAVYDELLDALRRLEHHFRDMCDVEFTVSSGELYILQTRIGRRSPLAAVRIAVDMADDPVFPLGRTEAAARVGDDVLQQLAALGTVEPAGAPVATGLAASPGVGAGVLSCEADRAAALAEAGTAVVLARNETSPADIHGMIGAAGLVTTLGGVASHAAVVARSWAIPAVCSLAGAVVEAGGIRLADCFIAEGETITVDGTNGAVYLGDCRSAAVTDLPELRLLREWATAEPDTSVEAGSDAPAKPASLFDVVRTIQLKGLCTAERAAGALLAGPASVEALIAANETLFKPTPRGFALTPEGRAWIAAQLAAERERVDRGMLEPCYERFIPLNDRFKRIVSEWQLSSGSGGDPAERLSALVASIEALHGEFRPIVAASGKHVARLEPYSDRFEAALAALAAGDTSMLASPLKDSYHTVWFEYHEELIALTGRDRANEAT